VQTQPVDRKRRPWLSWGRLFDAAAIAIVAFVAWKIFIAPRSFTSPGTHPAPHVAWERLDGGTFRLSDRRGRLVFMDFFASWCTPCKVELPLVERWAREHPEVDVVAVDVGEPRIAAEHFAKAMGLTNVVLDPQSSAQGYFDVRGFPTVVVVDPHGDVRASWPGLNPAIGLAMSNAEKALR
jgi:thiol-disulfide isomerase/thioredoxin